MPYYSNVSNEADIAKSNIMTTASTIKEAIARSVSHNEIVRCNVTTLTSGLRAVSEQADVDDHAELDDLNSDARFIDVWGNTWEGEEFRIYLFAAE